MVPQFKPFFLTFLVVGFIFVLYVSLWSWNNQLKYRSLKWLPMRSECISKNNFTNSSWINQFREHELKIYSQNGEDGVLLWLFANIGTINCPPRFVEFGVQRGVQCNTRFLRQHLGWQGLMMDGSNENITINLRREMITPKNINDLLMKYQTPSLLDLLSIDVDFDDYFVWKSILQADRFRARVVITEFNYGVPANENRVVNPYQDNRRWTGTSHYGAGILAMAALGRAHGYTLVYGEKRGVNLFFVQTSILKDLGVLHQVPSPKKLHVSRSDWKHRDERDKTRIWVWNDTIWKDN